MNIYQYVAANDPYGAKLLLGQYGYPLPSGGSTIDDLAEGLTELVARSGESALTAIVDLHPDKELILEKFGQRAIMQSESRGGGCGCGGKCGGGEKKATEQYINDARQSTGSGGSASFHQGNIMLIGAAFLLAVAIIASK